MLFCFTLLIIRIKQTNNVQFNSNDTETVIVKTKFRNELECPSNNTKIHVSKSNDNQDLILSSKIINNSLKCSLFHKLTDRKKCSNPNTIGIYNIICVDYVAYYNINIQQGVYLDTIIKFIECLIVHSARIAELRDKLEEILNDRILRRERIIKNDSRNNKNRMSNLNFDGIKDEIITFTEFIQNVCSITIIYEELKKQTIYDNFNTMLKIRELSKQLEYNLRKNDEKTNKFRAIGYFLPPGIHLNQRNKL